MSNCLQLPWTVAHQTPLSMEFSRQEYWSGLPFPSPGDLPNCGDQTHFSYVSCTGRRILYHWHYTHVFTIHCPPWIFFFSNNFGYISVEYLNYDVYVFRAEPCGKLWFLLSFLFLKLLIATFFHLLSFLCTNTKDLNSAPGYLNLSVFSHFNPLEVSLL